ncbi:hypothetical protein SAMN02745126_02023 [Enhydrobacter aerosaccus]|uniref:Uncharacterized protein n=2 Tax=Enhydrobacter aerosaccus TaxID=225324 RepID=A0A1T4MYG8_9HYPH|nr:hypothetical protein SAMN02745126_02023 [Enhydrobacter aerosaccus]
MSGSASLMIWVDIDPQDDAAFNHWHSREHMQERVSCPGWLRGSRFKRIDPTPEQRSRYLLFYDAEGTATFESEIYYARLRNPSEMSRAIFPKFRDTWRTVCAVEQRWGDGIGVAALTLRMKAQNTAPFDKLAALETVRVDLLVGSAAVGQAHTAEKELRPAPDRQIERALVAFFWSVEAAQAARQRHAPTAEIFTLQHTVSKDDL